VAGTIIADTIQASSQQISLNVGNTTILTASSTGLTLIPTNNVNINVTNSTVAFGSGNVSRPSISFSGNTSTGMYMPLANTIAFVTAGTEDMRITATGILDIGGTSGGSTGELLVVEGANSAGHRAARINNTGTTNGYSTLWMGSGNDGLIRAGSTAGTLTDQLLLLTSGATPVSFYTNNTERMRITGAGLLGVNATSFPYTEQVRVSFPNTQGLHLNETTSSSSVNFIYLTKGSGPTNVGAAYYNGSSVAWQTTSDYRLKENIVPLTNALDVVKNLKPKTYRWKESQAEDTGFIAHELQELFPQAVSGQKDEVDERGNPRYQGVDVSFLVATLTAAIQELKVIVDAQAVEIAALKAK